MFQSSAGHKPGRYRRHHHCLLPGLGFNPRPGINPAATSWGWMWGCWSTSFNPRPGINPAATRMLCAERPRKEFQSSAGHKPGRYRASIAPARPTACFNPRPGINPAATPPRRPCLAATWEFQSSAGHKPGRYALHPHQGRARQSFNPRPGINPAATCIRCVGCQGQHVSILGRA